MSLNETLLYPSSDDIVINGYHIVSVPIAKPLDAPRQSRGIALLIKETLAFNIVNHDRRPFEHIILETFIEGDINRLCRIVSIYNSPNDTLDINHLANITCPSIPHLILGDFNARHTSLGDIRINKNGRLLTTFIEKTPF